jgi:serine/threonine protein kinase
MTTVPVFAGYRDPVVVGEGGLGSVYRAIRVSTGGPVAIKEVREVNAASPAWRHARRELDAMLRVKGHAYVVNVEEILETDRGPAIVMEYVSGGSMHDRFMAGPIDPGEFVLVGSQVAQALDAAHGVGVVHRDLKPQNLLIGQFGQVKVCDFGIAALNRQGHRTVLRANTPAFASPEELADADEIGPPADVYSLAATLAHLARGGTRRTTGPVECGRELHEFMVRCPELRDLVEVLHRALRPPPHARPTMNALVDAFDDASLALGRNRARSIRPMWVGPQSLSGG